MKIVLNAGFRLVSTIYSIGPPFPNLVLTLDVYVMVGRIIFQKLPYLSQPSKMGRVHALRYYWSIR
jgi:hypothetical protein